MPRDARTRRFWGLCVLGAGLGLAGLWMALAPPETRAPTATEIRRIAQNEGLWDNRWNRHSEKARALGRELAATPHADARIDLRRRQAEQYLYAGQAELAASELQALLKEPRLPPAYQLALKEQLALAWLRLGEQQNCLDNPAAERCVFPLAGDALHQRRLGADRAYALYTELLRAPAASPEQRAQWSWLLNLAAMALGRYPEGVPEAWRIAPAHLASASDIGRFRDIAARAGADVFGLSGGVAMDDFDGDGRLDLMASSWGLGDALILLRNRGDMRFEDVSVQAGLEDIRGGLNLVPADYDNDGDTDVLVLRGAWLHDKGRHPNTLLRNDQGRFVDVTHAAGVYSRYPTQSAVWADFDNNGTLDLMVTNEVDRARVPWPSEARPFELYRNHPAGRFQDVGAASGMEFDGMAKGVTAGDYDNDGWTDIYISIWGRPNRLYRNLGVTDGGLRFEDVTERMGVGDPHASFPTWFWDFDNDGWLDLFVAGYSATLGAVALDYQGRPSAGARPRLYRNLAGRGFVDVAPGAALDALTLPMGSNYGDFDNDGWLDVLLGTGAPPLHTLTPNRAWRNSGGQRFEDITTSSGLGHLQKGHGVAFGDLDGDGDQDIYAVIGGAFEGDGFWNALYENPGHGHRWITLRLEGRQANREALGSRIRVHLRGGRVIHALVGRGGSFGASSVQQEIGLGAATGIDAIEVDWAGSGNQTRIPGPVTMDRVYRLIEGESELRAP